MRELNYTIVAKRPPDSNETGPIAPFYYLPSKLFIEPHVCLSLPCHIASLLLGDVTTTMYLAIVLAIIGLWKCR